MKVKDITSAIERLAPLSFQDSWDNSGLQVGDPEAAVTGILVCLDITPEILEEAMAEGCSMIVSHHPLIFHALKHLRGESMTERCVAEAIMNGLSIYSAHTSLDNAPGGVNHRIARAIGLSGLRWIEPSENGISGAGLIGDLPHPEDAGNFISRLADVFGVGCMRHSRCNGKTVSTVALCGGAGAFLAGAAAKAGADCFITGEIRYHDYFDPGLILIEMGHYQSEQFTTELLAGHLRSCAGDVPVIETKQNTNPIVYGA